MIMELFKITIKQFGQYNGCKVEKGMEVEVSHGCIFTCR